MLHAPSVTYVAFVKGPYNYFTIERILVKHERQSFPSLVIGNLLIAGTTYDLCHTNHLNLRHPTQTAFIPRLKSQRFSKLNFMQMDTDY